MSATEPAGRSLAATAWVIVGSGEVSRDASSAVSLPMTPPTAPTSSATTASAASARGCTRPPNSTSRRLRRAPGAGAVGVFGGRVSTGGPRPTGLSGLRHGSAAAPSAQNGAVGAVRAGRRAGRALEGVGVRVGTAVGGGERRPGAAPRVGRAVGGVALLGAVQGRCERAVDAVRAAEHRGGLRVDLGPLQRARRQPRRLGPGARRRPRVTGSAVCSVMCGRRSWAGAGGCAPQPASGVVKSA